MGPESRSPTSLWFWWALHEERTIQTNPSFSSRDGTNDPPATKFREELSKGHDFPYFPVTSFHKDNNLLLSETYSLSALLFRHLQ